MNRTELIDRYLSVVGAFELHPSEVVVSAGGACVMWKLREETADLDVHIPKRVYKSIRDKAASRGKVIRLPVRHGQPVEAIQYHDWLSIAPIEHYISTEEVDGVYVYDERSLLIQKLQLNRPKDQADIAALMTQHLAKQ